MQALGKLHFIEDDVRPEDANLKETLFNPHWVKDPVYTVLRASHLVDDSRHGVISYKKLPEAMNPDAAHAQGDPDDGEPLWKRLPFNDDDRENILTLMEDCRLAFRVTTAARQGKDRLIPDLLELNRESHGVPGVAARGTIEFDFLPEGLLLSLMCAKHDDIVEPSACFRNDVILFNARRELRARISADYDRNRISIGIWLQPAGRTEPDAAPEKLNELDARAFYGAICDKLLEFARLHRLPVDDWTERQGELVFPGSDETHSLRPTYPEKAGQPMPEQNHDQPKPDQPHPDSEQQHAGEPGRPQNLKLVAGYMAVVFVPVVLLITSLIFVWNAVGEDRLAFALVSVVLLLIITVLTAFVAVMTGVARGSEFHETLQTVLSKIPGLGKFISRKDDDADAD